MSQYLTPAEVLQRDTIRYEIDQLRRVAEQHDVDARRHAATAKELRLRAGWLSYEHRFLLSSFADAAEEAAVIPVEVD